MASMYVCFTCQYCKEQYDLHIHVGFRVNTDHAFHGCLNIAPITKRYGGSVVTFGFEINLQKVFHFSFSSVYSYHHFAASAELHDN